MGTSREIMDYILEQTSGAGSVSAKRMFGEYGLYCNGKIVGFVCDDELFIKPNEAVKAFIGEYKEGQPYPGAKQYILITGDCFDDADFMSDVIRIAYKALYPNPL